VRLHGAIYACQKVRRSTVARAPYATATHQPALSHTPLACLVRIVCAAHRCSAARATASTNASWRRCADDRVMESGAQRAARVACPLRG
jgi:hypothetical protein